MKRRNFLGVLGGAASWPLAARAQQVSPVPRVGLVSIGADPGDPVVFRPFLEQLRELGYIEYHNVILERRFAAGRDDLIDDFVADLVQRKVDIIVVTGNRESIAAKHATSTIPIVTIVLTDPIRTGLAASLARPGGAASNARSQSLIQALSTTYNSNPDLLAGRALLRQTDESLAQAVANWRPRVTLSLEYNKLEQDSIPIRILPTYYILNGRFTTLQLVQPLFRGGKTVADTKAAQANIQAQRATLADTEQNVLLAAVTSYADLVQNIAIADARRNNVLVLIQQLDATRERFRVGELTITDVSQAEARLEGARADLVQAEAQIRVAEATFQRTIGQKPGRLGEIPLIGGLPVSEDEAISLAMDFGPRAVSAQYRISAASYGVNSAISALLPQVNLVGVIQQQFDLQVPTDQYYTYGVRVQATIPIYQNGSEWSQVRQAKELVGQRRNELDSFRRAQAENVIIAWRQLDSSRSQVTSFEAQVRANEVALNGVRQEALVGSRTTLDVLNAEQELLNSQVSLVQARHDVQVAYYGVLAGVGRLTARTLALPVEYYDEERYYNEVGSKWIGWGTGNSGKPPVPAPTTSTSGGFGSK